MRNAVELHGVSMRFDLARERVDNIKEWFIRWLKGKSPGRDMFWALRDISFRVAKGDAFALVGRNGSGKSTLLKVISGILTPTKGEVQRSGSVAPLIELGAGFDMELTGRENVFLNGAVLGYRRRTMLEKYDEIMDFSELTSFADVPVKNYSSGMLARLGFAIATITKPDILIVDEVLAVGDYAFQKKCQERMAKLMNGGTTLLLVSHSAADVKRICRRAAWIERGVLHMVGETDEVLQAYYYA